MSQFSRRQFLYGSAAALGSLSTAGRSLLWAAGGRKGLPRPDKSGIKHVVVAMMENRSFDHLLGWLPGADGQQAGLVYTDALGTSFETYPLAPDFQGCSHPDPDHSFDGGRIELDGGLCDGFLRSGANDDYVTGYYVEDDRPFFSALARNYTTLDRSFCSILGPTFPNRFFLHSAQTDRLENTLVSTNAPTIWDKLLAAGVSAQYYWS